MFLTWLMLGVALCLSAIAAFYSIIGLTAIFAAAVIPVAIMGTILEIAKLTVTLWLHEYWVQCKRAMKVYMVPAVGVLMLITSMGIFGFLSKAHLDQAVPAGDISAQVTIYDEKIKTQRDNIETARAALRQMDAQVDQVLGRTNDEKGAERAVQIRRQQAAERGRLQADINRAQTEIQKLQEQRAPIAAQARKVEAEVGPIKYIAALIYGDNPDTNLLEKAVRWVIIILVIVFDPLAIFMLLAATESWKWEKQKRDSDAPDTVLAEELPKTAGERVREWRDKIALWRKPNDTNVDDDRTITKDLVNQSPGPGLVVEPVAEVVGRTETPPVEYKILDDADEEDARPISPPNLTQSSVDDDEDNEDDEIMKAAQKRWKAENPQSTLKEQRRLLATGQIAELPWIQYLDPDNMDIKFGPEFPSDLLYKGRMFVRTDIFPTQLYKYNGKKWIEVDKALSDRYVYNPDYIDLLILKISTGEYDPELLNEAERNQLEKRLQQELA